MEMVVGGLVERNNRKDIVSLRSLFQEVFGGI